MTISFADTTTIDNMFQAVEDGLQQRVDGTEGYSLTPAQHFAGGVLMANDMIHSSVMGNESLFSSIGKGIANTWKWIKEQFKKIYSFFFRREAKKEAQEAETSLDKAKNTLKSIKDVDFNEMSEAFKNSVAAKMSSVYTSIAAIFENGLIGSKALEGVEVDGVEKLTKKLEQDSEEGKKLLEKAKEKIEEFKSGTGAKAKANVLSFYDTLKSSLGLSKKMVDAVNETEATVNKEINELSKTMEDSKAEVTSEDKKRQSQLRKILSSVGGVAAKMFAGFRKTKQASEEVAQQTTSKYDYVYTG